MIYDRAGSVCLPEMTYVNTYLTFSLITVSEAWRETARFEEPPDTGLHLFVLLKRRLQAYHGMANLAKASQQQEPDVCLVSLN